MNKEPTPEIAFSSLDSEEVKTRLAAFQGRMAVRNAFEGMMQKVDAGEADRDETIAAMSSVMRMISGYGRAD